MCFAAESVIQRLRTMLSIEAFTLAASFPREREWLTRRVDIGVSLRIGPIGRGAISDNTRGGNGRRY